MINKEIERKIILTKDEYLNINDKFKMKEEKIQVNYYFDTQDYSLAKKDETLRVRQSDQGLMLEYKFNKLYSEMVRECQEYTFSIKHLPLEVSSDMITPFYNREKNKFFLQGQLVTHRKIFSLDTVKICLDRNYYLGKIDFELEIEGKSEEIIEKNIEIFGWPHVPSSIGKYKRFLREKEIVSKSVLE